MAKEAKSGGGRLNRSETVTVRLDPKLNYLCELAARAQRRTKSSFVEWAIEKALDQVLILGSAPSFDGQDISISEQASSLWDVDEPDRIAALAFHAPSLMTHDEQLIWKLVRDCGLIWKGYYSKSNGIWQWTPDNQSLMRDRLHEHWDTFKNVANGDLPKSRLPSWIKISKPEKALPNANTDFDEDIPF
jgi:hypothetical protein